MSTCVSRHLASVAPSEATVAAANAFFGPQRCDVEVCKLSDVDKTIHWNDNHVNSPRLQMRVM